MSAIYTDPGQVPAGTSTSVAKVGGQIQFNTTNVGNISTGEDNLMGYAMPADVLVTNGDYIEVEAWGQFAANANAKTVKLYFGATTLINSGAVAINNGSWHFKATIIRTSATAQKASAQIFGEGTLLAARTSATTPAETLSGAITIKCTGEATSNNDIVQNGLVVRWNPAGNS